MRKLDVPKSEDDEDESELEVADDGSRLSEDKDEDADEKNESRRYGTRPWQRK